MARATAALLFEAAWPGLVALATVVALFFILSWLGLWIALPPWSRGVGVGLFGLAAALVVAHAVRTIRWPHRTAALARLDRDSLLPHRPVSTALDDLANQHADPATQALWDLHRKRLAGIMDRITVARPSPRLAARDVFALRAGVLVALVAAAFVAGPEKDGRVAAAFAWSSSDVVAQASRIDAWIDPPGYTGRPPLVLIGTDAAANRASDAAVSAPAGSAVVVRAAGEGQVTVSADGGLHAAAAAAPGAAASGAGAPPHPGYTDQRFTLAGDGHLRIMRDSVVVKSLVLSAIPDLPPRIAVIGTPAANLHGTLALAYKIEDDYGATGAEARFSAPIVRGHPVTGRSLVEAPHAPLALPPLPGGLGEGKTTIDLSDHPWAGAQVTMTLVAHDEGGNTGESAPVTLTLPAKPFTKPMAKALVEQRRDLVLNPDDRAGVAMALDALLLAPEEFDTPLPVYLGLTTARTRLAQSKSDADLLGVADFLWEMALRIENGDLTQTEQDLRAAQKALKDAMDRGAAPDEIKKLTDALRQQMDKYLAEMMQNRDREGSRDEAQAQQNRNGKTVTQKDLQSLIDKMEQAARNGDMAEAQRLLDQLNNIMENLKTAKRGQAQSQATREMNRSMNELDKMMRDQGDVRDKTFNQEQQDQDQQGQEQQGQDDQNQSADGTPKDGQGQDDSDNGNPQTGRPGKNGKPGFGDLQGRQQALRGQLDAMQRKLKGLGMKGEQGLADAQDAMKDAEGALGRGDGRGAVEAQGRALEGMQRGANGLQQQMAQNGQGPDGQAQGEGGEDEGQATQQGEDVDPLGRPRQGHGASQDHGLDVSGGLAARAQRVLEELRRRLGDPTRSQDEQDYLERLLKRY